MIHSLLLYNSQRNSQHPTKMLRTADWFGRHINSMTQVDLPYPWFCVCCHNMDNISNYKMIQEQLHNNRVMIKQEFKYQFTTHSNWFLSNTLSQYNSLMPEKESLTPWCQNSLKNIQIITIRKHNW